MKKLGSICVALATLVVGIALSPGAHAAWTFGSGSTVAADSSGIAIKSITGAYSANGGTLASGAAGTSIVAAGATCADTICGVGAANTYGISGFSGTTWTAGVTASNLQLYSGNGLGMASDSTLVTSPNHALDNGPATDGSNLIKSQANGGRGNTEAVLLGFDSSVVLSSIGVGWKSGDADISLFRYTGAVTPTTTLSMNGVGNSLSNMAAAGWELVGNYGNLATDTSNPYNLVNGCTGTTVATATCASTSKGSSWWLISAFNNSYGSGANLDQGNDYFKLYAVAGAKCTSTVAGVCGPSNTPPAAPEPASLALVAVGLVGAVGIRRRRGSAAAAAA